MALLDELPGPLAEVWDWQLQARCRGLDSSIFYSREGERGSHRLAREARAKQLCYQCPVIARCRNHAVTSREVHGIWGGLTPLERDRLCKPVRIRSG